MSENISIEQLEAAFMMANLNQLPLANLELAMVNTHFAIVLPAVVEGTCDLETYAYTLVEMARVNPHVQRNDVLERAKARFQGKATGTYVAPEIPNKGQVNQSTGRYVKVRTGW
jgi:hypothetical protein